MANDKNTADKIVNLPLSDIFIDNSWNTRSDVGAGSSGGDDEENTDEGLMASIGTRGQEEPVRVRPTPKELKRKEPYMLVYGFRRAWAIGKLAEKNGDKNPTIKARVSDLTEEQARELNLAENTARDSLATCDIAYGIARVLEHSPQRTSVAISQEVGLNQGYVATIMRVVQGLKKGLLQKWRDQRGKKLTLAEMERISKLTTKEEQEAAFAEYAKKHSETESEEQGANAWKKANKAKAEAFGKLFGGLQREGLLEVGDPEMFFLQAFEGGFFGRLKRGAGKELSDKEKHAVADVAFKAWEAAVEADDDTSGETSEDIKAKKVAAKNGKPATAN